MQTGPELVAKVGVVPIAVVIGLCSAVLTALVTEIYCHRFLAHRAFRIHPALASFLDAYFQVTGGANPQTWAAIHRVHHRYADTPLDPHSPLEGRFLAVLVGTPYLFAMARRQLPENTAPGTGIAHLGVRALVLAFFYMAFGLAQVLTMLAVHLVCYLGIMGMVNSVGHLHGRKPHPESPGYDSAWLAIPLLGHGYHNSHHAHPAAARTGLLDPIWPLLRLLSGLRLVDLDDQRNRLCSPACCPVTSASLRNI